MENKTHDLKVEKTIDKSPAEVFRAIGEGRLFMNCSADQESLQIDFKVGGKYSIQFKNFDMHNTGEFLEVVPNERIAFTWCQDYDESPVPDTTVLILLRDVDGKTAITLTHTGFTDQDNRDGHTGGWTGGLNDLSDEIVKGVLRFNRQVAVPVEALLEICTAPEGVLEGAKIEPVSEKMLVANLDGTKITLSFETDDEDEDASWLEITHEGLASEAQQKAGRKKWDSFFNHFTDN